MKQKLKIFLLLSKYSMKVTLQHRVGVISFLFGKIIRFGFYFMFIYFLVSKTKIFAGYTIDQTLVFFMTFNFLDTLAQLIFREVYRFRPLIISGELDNILLKPHHPFLKILIGGIDALDMIMLIPYTFMLMYFIFRIPHLQPLHLLLYAGFIINGMLIATSFHILVLSVAIYTTEIDHLILIYRDITRMVSLPIDMYKEPFKFILMFIIPVGIMMAIPVKALFGLLSIQMIIITCSISVFFLIFSLWLWNNALKKYQSWGG